MLNIYVATHKLFIPPLKKYYIPITSKKHLPYLKDNFLNNISYMNEYYSELTCLYWVWQNSKSDIYGLNHYHRYFYLNHLLNKEEIKDILKNHEIIVPKKWLLDDSIYKQYGNCHYIKDLDLTIKQILKYDKTYKNVLNSVLNRKEFYAFNMFIAKKEIINEYLEFLFNILFNLESIIPYFKYPSYQKRVFGFLAERIFNIYLEKKQYNLYEYPVIDTKITKKLILK